MTGRPRINSPPASAKSDAALTRAPSPVAGGTGAGRGGETGGPGLRNAGLGVTNAPDNRDERSAISANPSVRSSSVSGDSPGRNRVSALETRFLVRATGEETRFRSQK